MTADHGPGIRLVDCPECDASTSTVALCRAMQCPQCDEPLEPCPACGQWFRPFDGTFIADCCEHCGLDRWVIVGLRRGDRTLATVRDDPRIPQLDPVAEPAVATDGGER